MADRLKISRKTYVLFESARWYPPYKERAHMLRCLRSVDEKLVPVFCTVTGQAVEEHVLTVVPPRAAALSEKAARAAYEVAVAEVAAEREMTIVAVKRVAAGLFGRLSAVGVPIDDAAKFSAGG